MGACCRGRRSSRLLAEFGVADAAVPPVEAVTPGFLLAGAADQRFALSVDPHLVGPVRTGASGRLPGEIVAPAAEGGHLGVTKAGHGGAVGEDDGLAGGQPAQVDPGADTAEQRQAGEAAAGGAGEVAWREGEGELAEVDDGALWGGGGQVAAGGGGGVAAEAGEAVAVVQQVGGGAGDPEGQAERAAGQGDQRGQTDADGDLAAGAEAVPSVAERVQRAGQPWERCGGKRVSDLPREGGGEEQASCQHCCQPEQRQTSGRQATAGGVGVRGGGDDAGALLVEFAYSQSSAGQRGSSGLVRLAGVADNQHQDVADRVGDQRAGGRDQREGPATRQGRGRRA